MDNMVDNQGNTYSPLEGRRPIDSPEAENIPPRDESMCVYFGLVMAGIGFVLPYNSFIIASDFWQTRFPGRSVALDLSMTYIVVAFATVLLNNVFLSLFSFRVRILFGYIISLTTFLFVAVCEVAIQIFSVQTAYAANLAAVSLTAIGCTVQQSSFYGFASMFPKQYTQAVMTGESVAGFVVATTRILTKLIITNDRVSTFCFLLMSVCYIGASYAFHVVTINSPFVVYHTKQCARIVLRPDEDRVLSDGEPSAAAKYGVLSRDSSSNSPPLQSSGHHPAASHPTGLSFSNPVYELSNPSAGESTLDGINNLPASDTVLAAAIIRQHETTPNVGYKVEHILTPGTCSSSRFGDFKSGLESRWRVAHAIYPYMVSIALAYCVTLSLYPGIESEIISCNLKTWMPVLLMFTFNSSDLIGKMIAIIPYNWTRRQLILLSGMRGCLIPLLLLCCSPRDNPVIAGEASAFVFSAALGVTNGLAGSLPMMLAPAKVPATLKEVTGNMMTLSYNVGLTAGSLIGYVFELMLGPQMVNPCPSFPYIASTNTSHLYTTPSTTTTALVTTMMAATSTTVAAAAPIAPATVIATVAAAATTIAPSLTTFAAASATTLSAAVTSTGLAALQHSTALPETTTRLLATAFYNVTEFVANATTASAIGTAD